MEYKRFRQFVEGGEKATVDFKIACDAFKGDVAANGELAKDICAMANNGNVFSYIILGVSDDGRNFKSVDNKNLTDDKLQDFCKKAVYPPPRVKLVRKRWMRARPEHKGKTFVVIMVGRHARYAYRLNQDFVNYDKKVCYRRNEVWIRRGATSDLATPEEVARLVQRLPPQEMPESLENVTYAHLTKEQQEDAVLRDLYACVKEEGGKMVGGRMVLPIRGIRYVWRPVVRTREEGSWWDWSQVVRHWQYEHALLIVSTVRFPSKAFEGPHDIRFREKWGWFVRVQLAFRWLSGFFPRPVIGNFEGAQLIFFGLPSVKDTKSVYTRFSQLTEFLESNDKAYSYTLQAREELNARLRRCLDERLFVYEDNVWDRRQKRFVKRRIRDKDMEKDLKAVVSLSEE